MTTTTKKATTTKKTVTKKAATVTKKAATVTPARVPMANDYMTNLFIKHQVKAWRTAGYSVAKVAEIVPKLLSDTLEGKVLIVGRPAYIKAMVKALEDNGVVVPLAPLGGDTTSTSTYM